MNSFRILDRRAGYFVAAFAMLLSVFVPALAFADLAEERSVQLSSSKPSATGVSYDVRFTAKNAAEGFVVEFCSNSPAVGATCTAPTGMTAATGATGGTLVGASTTANKATITKAIAANDEVEVTLTGIGNSSTAGVQYARVATYDTEANAATYTDVGRVDTGSVAIYLTADDISVRGSVLETLTFCASGATIDAGCAGTITTPSLNLGANGILTDTVSEGTVYTQISTNATLGAVVNLKSSAVGCGGLIRIGASAADGCGITPKTTAGAIATGDSAFGLRFGTTEGDITLAGNYDATNFYMNYVDGDATGVTSTYGDAIYNTSDAPITNGGAPLIFGANIGSDTPAGTYSATFNLIATGKF